MRKISEVRFWHLAVITLVSALVALAYAGAPGASMPLWMQALYFIAIEVFLALAYMGFDQRKIIDMALFIVLAIILAMLLYFDATRIQMYDAGSALTIIVQAAVVLGGGFAIRKMFKNRDEDIKRMEGAVE